MKTAMQDLQEKITALINDSKGTGSNRDNPDYRIGLHQALGLIDLETEKEQIMEAYHKGQVAIFDIIKAAFPQHKFEATQHEVDLVESGKEKNEDAEDYYQQTYNPEQ